MESSHNCFTSPLRSCVIFFNILLLILFCDISQARSVEKGDARQAVRGWIRHNKMPMDRSISDVVADIQTMKEKSQSLCYIVNLEPEGFVIISPDTEIEPIIAFSSSGRFDADENNPLTTLLKKDMKGRLQTVREKKRNQQNTNKETRKWEALTTLGNAGSVDRLQPKSDDLFDMQMLALSVSEVWVDPFVLSEWDQGDVGGSPCYNYYTPNNYVVGCVATAMAQLMRYHTYPTSGIGVHAFTIEVNGVSQTAYTRGGNGSGGAYNWTQMPYDPQSSVTTPQREAIGALCYDAGVTARMSYTSSSSGASLVYADQELTDTFDFSNSIYTRSFSSFGDSRLWNILNANLDAKLPVILGISRTGGGHAVVADGYGYTGDTLYHHINMGWGGADNAWYQLPTIDASYTYTVIDDCIYNVYPTGSGEIISGRVTNMAGSPLENVTVSAYQGTTLIKQTTTDSRGVFALTQLSSNTSYTISASKIGENFLDQTVTTGHSVDLSTPGNRSGILFVSANTGPPTAYDIQADVDAGDSVLIQLEGLDDGVPDPNLFRCIITSLPSHGILSEPNVGFIETIPYELTSSICDVNYIPCPYFGGQDAFTYKANDGGTYPTGGDSNIATVTVNVDNQVSTSLDGPTNTYTSLVMGTGEFYDARAQIIMLGSEIGSAQVITDLVLDVYAAPGGTLNNWTIRIQHTNWTEYPSGYDVTYMVLTSGWTVVYQANETIAQTGWHTFHLDTPFEYNGSQNLLIDLSYNNSALAFPSGGYFIQTSIPETRTLGLGSETGTHGNPLYWDFWSTGGTYYPTNVPSIQLVGEALVDPIVGDFDASCDVKMPDFAIFSQAWMTMQGQGNYNVECDLTTTKGAVDLQDLLILMGQWMQTYDY